MNLHRCYLRRDSVFLRFLARLAGRDVDRHFFRRLQAACAYALLRNSFSGKWGSFARQQQPLPSLCYL